jgi:hypothetical protein
MWWLATGALGVLSAMRQGDQAEQQAWAKKNQIEWDNHLGRLQMDRQNREIAAGNAAQWMANQEITKGAYQQEAEQKVYLRHRIDNELGIFSRNAASQTATICSLNKDGKNQTGSMEQEMVL